MIALIATTLVASLAGSLHCAGMCGPLLLVMHRGRPSPVLHIAYQTGRVATYTALGVAAGVLGRGVDTLAAARGLEHAALGLTAMALVSMLVIPRWRTKRHAGFGLDLMRGALMQAAPPLRALLFGAATGLMPCGWLYAWLAVAMGTGTALAGGAVMGAFAVGSIPALWSSNVLLVKAHALLRHRAPRLVPIMVIASAVLALAMRGAFVERLHHTLSEPVAGQAPLTCHGG